MATKGINMRVLLIGSGGREHALAWKIAQSPRLTKLWIAPGNSGTGLCGENVPLDVADHAAVVSFAREHAVDLVVIGPDAPAVAGLADDVRGAGIRCFGPSKAAAQLEGSKAFTKALCDEAGIPTAAWARFETEGPALAYLRERGAPIVIKADGLALGKGVTVAVTLAESEAAVRDCFAGTFGVSGSAVVIEDFLVGEEASVFAVSDGERFVMLETAQDHKRAFDGDIGPNTGGMGAYSPAPVMTPEMMRRTVDEIIAPTIAGMKARGTPFQGVLYLGVMVTAEGPKLIEYNVRFGDPECQVLMMRMTSDLLDLLEASAKGDIRGVMPTWRDEVALTVVMAAKGYPGPYPTGSEIVGARSQNDTKVQVFEAGTTEREGRLFASGGRVLNVTALGKTVKEAQSRAYSAVDAIVWPDGVCRRDIGWRAIGRMD
jgi:phosphoribosylamine--glycine ligase